MSPQLHLTAAVAVVVATAWFAYNRGGVGTCENDAETSFGDAEVWRQYEVVPIENGAVGPESFAFDPRGEGPYTGVSDGRIIKWHRPQNRWLNFAVVTSSHGYALSVLNVCIYVYISSSSFFILYSILYYTYMNMKCM